MSSVTLIILLVIANLIMFNSGKLLKNNNMTFLVYSLSIAYRIYLPDDTDEVLFVPNEKKINIDDEELLYLMNLKQTLEKNNCMKTCNIQPPITIAEPSRRDTKFLRFGRKR